MEEIINNLKYFDEKFPRETLIKAVNMKEEITETLLKELDNIVESPEIAIENQDYMLHIYSMYLLAQFREKRAFKKIIDLISFSPDEVDLLIGDTITEGLSSILYSTFDGDLNLLQSTIENSSLNIYARGAVLDVYGRLYSDEKISKEECISYLRELIYAKHYDLNSDLATDVQGIVVDRHIFEMVDDIQYLYDERRIDTSMFGKYDDFIDLIYSYEDNIESVRYIDDVIKEISWWACFEKTEDEKRKVRIEMNELKESIYKEKKLAENILKKTKKIGRNDPCPCGSGKKYKKCCLGNEMSSIEPLGEQRMWLKYYPIEEGKRSDDEIRITDLYDKESINIDKLVYLALHHRAIPMWIKRDKLKEEMIMISYLIKAYEKFLSKCKEEGISSFSEYDVKHKIHYRSKDWIKKLNNLIDESDKVHTYGDVLKSTKEMLSKFS